MTQRWRGRVWTVEVFENPNLVIGPCDVEREGVRIWGNSWWHLFLHLIPLSSPCLPHRLCLLVIVNNVNSGDLQILDKRVASRQKIPRLGQERSGFLKAYYTSKYWCFPMTIKCRHSISSCKDMELEDDWRYFFSAQPVAVIDFPGKCKRPKHYHINILSVDDYCCWGIFLAENLCMVKHSGISLMLVAFLNSWSSCGGKKDLNSWNMYAWSQILFLGFVKKVLSSHKEKSSFPGLMKTF